MPEGSTPLHACLAQVPGHRVLPRVAGAGAGHPAQQAQHRLRPAAWTAQECSWLLTPASPHLLCFAQPPPSFLPAGNLPPFPPPSSSPCSTFFPCPPEAAIRVIVLITARHPQVAQDAVKQLLHGARADDHGPAARTAATGGRTGDTRPASRGNASASSAETGTA